MTAWLIAVVRGTPFWPIVITIILILAGVELLRKIWPSVRRTDAVARAVAALPDTDAETARFRSETADALQKLQKQILNNHPSDPNMREEITQARLDIAKVTQQVADIVAYLGVPHKESQ